MVNPLRILYIQDCIEAGMTYSQADAEWVAHTQTKEYKRYKESLKEAVTFKEILDRELAK